MKFNLPFDRVHDIDCGYGWIIIPWFNGYWIGIRDQWKKKNIFGADGKPMTHGYAIRKFKRFHNCTATGIY